MFYDWLVCYITVRFCLSSGLSSELNALDGHELKLRSTVSFQHADRNKKTSFYELFQGPNSAAFIQVFVTTGTH
jgi:hypothetical protein